MADRRGSGALPGDLLQRAEPAARQRAGARRLRRCGLLLSPAARPVPKPTHPQTPAGRPRQAGESTEPLVVDGSNLAWNGRPPRTQGGRPSFAALQAAVTALRFKHPQRDIHVVVDASLRHQVSAEERPLVEQAVAEHHVVQPPAGTEGRGDALVISIAEEVGGIIVSNDNFAPFQKDNPWLLSKGRVMGATQSHGVWVFTARTPNPATGAVRH
ncbi:hypothetical protein AB0L10_04275 [Streptomyces flaveolus]|uniref:NYN domain-containing protein n=1 Tax=Streptomyces flaveolus TaxID=67297 RepID=UPI00343321AA